MGGDDSQKLLPWRGISSSPGRGKPPAHYEINTVTENGAAGLSGPDDRVSAFTYRLPGSFLESRGGSLLESAEGSDALCNRVMTRKAAAGESLSKWVCWAGTHDSRCSCVEPELRGFGCGFHVTATWEPGGGERSRI